MQITGRILGILWAIGYLAEDKYTFFYIRHKNKSIIEEIRQFFNIKSKIIEGESFTGKQYKLKITSTTKDLIMKELLNQGWTPRNSSARYYPKNLQPDQHKDFIFTWIEIHSSFDYHGCGKGKQRLRVYGNKTFIEELNQHIHRIFGCGIKKPQITVKGTNTYALYYQNKHEVECLLERKL